MKKNAPTKLSLSRESVRRLDDAELRSQAGGAVTNPCPFTVQVLACYSADVHTCRTCVCTV